MRNMAPLIASLSAYQPISLALIMTQPRSMLNLSGARESSDASRCQARKINSQDIHDDPRCLASQCMMLNDTNQEPLKYSTRSDHPTWVFLIGVPPVIITNIIHVFFRQP